VIGGGERDGELREVARALDIHTRTTFLGIVHEGVPITLIEAMAAGLPIVATDCGSVRDVVTDGENGFVVPVGDVAAFADRLQLLAGDPLLRKRLGRSGRRRAEVHFRIENTARRYEELLSDVAARKG
jgi:glycosyltransferase involved in cell wall biosynthesis